MKSQATNRPSSWALAALIVASFMTIQCGKKDDDGKNKGSKEQPRVSGHAEDGQAHFTIDYNGGGKLFCKFAAGTGNADTPNDWFDCTGKRQVSYPAADGSAVSLFVKVGQNGTLVGQTIS